MQRTDKTMICPISDQIRMHHYLAKSEKGVDDCHHHERRKVELHCEESFFESSSGLARISTFLHQRTDADQDRQQWLEFQWF